MGNLNELNWPEPWYAPLEHFVFSGYGFVSIILLFIAAFLLFAVPYNEGPNS